MASANSTQKLWADVAPDAARRLLLAALDAFAQKGYFATTTREIAQQVGLSPAAVYVHYPSKNEMLAEICRRGHAAILADLERALEEPGTPTERVRRFVSVFSSFHAAPADARAGHSVRAARAHARAVPRDRDDPRALRGPDPRGAARRDRQLASSRSTTSRRPASAILSLCIDVARWHGALSDRLSADELGVLYADLVTRMIRLLAI